MDVERFVRESLNGYGAQFSNGTRRGTIVIQLAEVRASVRDAMAVGDEGSIQVCFALPCPPKAALLTRTHLLVQGLAGFVLDSALDARLSSEPLARRCGVVRTHAVKTRVALLLLRERFQIRMGVANGGVGPQELLAEDWQLIAFKGSSTEPEWLSQEEAETLLAAQPEANIAPDLARAHLGKLLDALPPLLPQIEAIVRQRGGELLSAHRRVRQASRLNTAQTEVEPKLPADILGVYLYLPASP